MILSFTVSGIPVGKGRARFSTRNGIARAYTPAKTRRFEDMGGRDPIDEGVLVSVTAYVPMPKSWSKKKRELAVDGAIKPIVRPDADNFSKAALDGCNAIIFRDDSLVTDLIVRKRYSERPRLVITVETETEYA